MPSPRYSDDHLAGGPDDQNSLDPSEVILLAFPRAFTDIPKRYVQHYGMRV